MTTLYDHRIVYVGSESSIQELLDAGWEPVPYTVPVLKYGTIAHPQTYVWLRRART